MARHLMPAYVAFLRAINVAGHAVVKMDRLQRAFLEAGCEETKTVIQGGDKIIEKELGVLATTRNWSTVMRIADLLDGGAGSTNSKGGKALRRAGARETE